MPRSKILNTPESNSFAASFIHLKLGGNIRKITWRWDKARKELGYRIVNKILCSLEGCYILFQRCINLDAQEQWTGLT